MSYLIIPSDHLQTHSADVSSFTSLSPQAVNRTAIVTANRNVLIGTPCLSAVVLNYK